MYIAVVLMLWAGALAMLAPWLATAPWTRAAPRLALVAWKCILASLVSALLIAGTIWWHDAFEPALAWALHAKDAQIDAAYRLPHLSRAWVVTLVTTVALLHVLITVVRELVWQLRTRLRHQDALDLLSTDRDGRYAVVDHERPAVYCVPGRRARVVVTSAALDVLDPHELAAVLAHESEHLRARHHGVIIVSKGLVRATPKLPFARAFATAVAQLAEMAADDAAVRVHGRTTTARALFKLASGGQAPPAVMAAGGSDVAERLHRITFTPRLTAARRTCVTTALLAAVLIPPAAVAIPGFDVAGGAHVRASAPLR